jgi:hypothetical protein
MDKQKIGQALEHLRCADPVMRDVISRAGPFRLKLRRDRFHALVSSILSQQISGKAAASIRARLEEYVAPERVSPESLGRLTPRQLRAIGVCAPEKRPAPKDTILTPGFGYSITPVSYASGRENRVHFSYAWARSATAPANNPIPYTSPEAVFPAVAGHPEKRSDEGPALAFS